MEGNLFGEETHEVGVWVTRWQVCAFNCTKCEEAWRMPDMLLAEGNVMKHSMSFVKSFAAVVICLFLYSCNQFLSCMCWVTSHEVLLNFAQCKSIFIGSPGQQKLSHEEKGCMWFLQELQCHLWDWHNTQESSIDHLLSGRTVALQRGSTVLQGVQLNCWNTSTWQCNVMARRMERPFDTPLSPMNSRQLCSRQKQISAKKSLESQSQ